MVLKFIPKVIEGKEHQKPIREAAILNYIKDECDALFLCFENLYETPSHWIIESEFLAESEELSDYFNRLAAEDPAKRDKAVVDLLEPLIQIITKMHQLGIAHRDIHGGNVMIHTPTGKLKIIDFGQACVGEEDCRENLPPLLRSFRLDLDGLVDIILAAFGGDTGKIPPEFVSRYPATAARVQRLFSLARNKAVYDPFAPI